MALLIIGSTRSSQFAEAARALAPSMDIRVWPNKAGRIEDIRYALAWIPPPGALRQLPNLELIVSVGAGVDHIFKDPELPAGVPLVRFVDPDLTGRMTQYVTLHVLWHHRRMCEFIEQQRVRQWKYLPEPAAQEIRVGLMGLGQMGLGAAKGLAPHGYRLRGWSRSEHRIEGIECFAGEASFEPFLAETDILVSILPLTQETRGILNMDVFRKLSTKGRHPRMPGPAIINAGRGGLQVEADILKALETGVLHSASLDVFETEPLPADSPIWESKRIVVTPHNASESEPYAIVRYALKQIKAKQDGRPLENIVDPTKGY
ncbi:MAG: glyoxylate/hydroxypyruvate reductase A [Hyphomicrobiaceae bacterium]|nr:MAG: glyoxylate/hydroxypyruvate reductase A [Hyphomicrobiaceae bacterium]